jgi:inner membrane protein
MDNLTHSVVGLGIGALIDRSLAAEPDQERRRTRSRMLLVIACLASNFPDLDLFLTPLLDRPLGYLLHHRGHTHTLIGALLELTLLLGAITLFWPAARRLQRVSVPARWGAWLAAVAGLLLHIGMDGLNVYGVHPFWPFDPSWYYGDLVFIVEPVFWIAFGVPLAALVRRPFLRRAWLAVLVLVPLAAALTGFLQWGSLLGLLALGLALVWIQRRNDEHHGETRAERGRMALTAGLAASLAFVGVQALALQGARTLIATELARIDAGERVLDTALSAYPSNPLCWSFVTVARTGAGESGTVHLRRGMLSIAPGLAPVSHCPARIAGPALEDAPPQIALQSEDRAPVAALRTLAANDCRVNAWLRFARAPSLAEGAATDVRWGEPGGGNFSTLAYGAQAGKPCPRFVPRWGYPRADLLSGR